MNFISLTTCKVSESHVENSQTSSAWVSGFDWPASAPEGASQLPAAAPSSSQRSGCVTRTLTWCLRTASEAPSLGSLPPTFTLSHTGVPVTTHTREQLRAACKPEGGGWPGTRSTCMCMHLWNAHSCVCIHACIVYMCALCIHVHTCAVYMHVQCARVLCAYMCSVYMHVHCEQCVLCALCTLCVHCMCTLCTHVHCVHACACVLSALCTLCTHVCTVCMCALCVHACTLPTYVQCVYGTCVLCVRAHVCIVYMQVHCALACCV